MKRKSIIIFSLSLLATMLSCSKADVVVQSPFVDELELVSISPVTSITSKAAVDGTVFPDSRTILASAYHNSSEPGNYFNSVTFNKNGSVWSADKYWPLSGTLDIFGVSYDGLSVTNITYPTKVSEGISFDVPDNSSSQIDILHASATEQSHGASGVSMEFKHAESVLVFTAKTTVAYDASANKGITINKITLNNAKHSGHLSISSTKDDDEGYCVWSSLGSQKNIDLPGITGYHVPTTAMDITAAGNHFGIGGIGIVVPEQAQTSFTVYYTQHNGKTGGGAAIDVAQEFTYTCFGNWAEGKKNCYKINFKSNAIQIYPTVEDWVTYSEDVIYPEPVAATYSVTAGTSVSLPKATLAANSEVMVDWQDGNQEAFTNITKSSMDDDELTLSHTYSSAFTGEVEIVVRAGSIDFGELKSEEFAKFTVFDDSKFVVAKDLGLLSGVFTVCASPLKKVKFAKGNLMANVNADGDAVLEWKLADHQYDYVGNTTAQQNGNNYCFKVASSFGCILKPDGFTGTVNDVYTAAEWVSAEASGLVFIPLAGYRLGSSVSDVGGYSFC